MAGNVPEGKDTGGRDLRMAEHFQSSTDCRQAHGKAASSRTGIKAAGKSDSSGLNYDKEKDLHKF